MSVEFLDSIFNPRGIAVVGASDRPESVGSVIFHNLLTSFKNPVYPVNVKRDTVQGVKAYPSVRNLPSPVDLAVICTPSQTVLSVVEECGRAGIRGIIIISAGFAEMGEEGKQALDKIKEVRAKYGMRIIGPNCLGVIRPLIEMNATFAKASVPRGKIAFISQSGALGTAVLDWALSNKRGMSTFVSIGTTSDVDFGDLIEYFNNDTETECIFMYIESISDVKKFLKAAQAFASKKPIFAVKSGREKEGAKAAASHTGALAGEDILYDTLFKTAGIVRIETTHMFFTLFQALSLQPLPSGNRLLILTNAGGPGVMATDYLVRHKGRLAELSQNSLKCLNEFLPPFWSRSNPVDILGDAGADRYSKALDCLLKDENIDGIVVILTPQAMTEFKETAQGLVERARNSKKPVLAAWMGENLVLEARHVLAEGGIPSYSSPEEAVSGFLALYESRTNINRINEPQEDFSFTSPDLAKIKAQLGGIINSGRIILSERESKSLLEGYGIKTTRPILAKSPEEAARIAKEIGFPVAMKIESEDISHKSDANCVMLNISEETEAYKNYDIIINNAKAYKSDARIEGVIIQEMVKERGFEVILGSKKDPLFGSLVLFGMGGTAVEVLKDTNLEFAPLNKNQVHRLIEGTKIYTLLKEGFREIPPANLPLLVKTIIRFSHLASDLDEVREIDINPLRVNNIGCVALDARVILNKKEEQLN